MNVYPVFESDAFLVVHILEATDACCGYEVVDKDNEKVIYLTGGWKDVLEAQREYWKKNAPSTEEVDDYLRGFAILAQNPLRFH